MTTKTDEQERKDFEAFMSSNGKFPRAIERNSNGDYVLMQAASSWHVWQKARAALQDQPAIPDEIRLMAERIVADRFEHCTSDPIFTVERRKLIAGLDLDYCEDVGWFCDGVQITGDEAKALEAAYEETTEIPDDHTRTGIMEEWEHFATYVTMEAAQEYAAKKGSEYRVYVDSGCRNHEWKALRAFLLGIARRTEGET